MKIIEIFYSSENVFVCCDAAQEKPRKKTHTHTCTLSCLFKLQVESEHNTERERERESVSASARERGLSGYVSGSERVRGRAL